MKIDYLPSALKALDDAPSQVQKAFFKQVKFLENNLLHPSLHAQKYDESMDIWQARINKDWRFYFTITDDTYTIIRIIPHSK
jgi:mRNA-degrading endonuclease RelE of RelBE toxin-antitoxin system